METVFTAEEVLKKEYPMGGNEMEEAEFAILEVGLALDLQVFCVEGVKKLFSSKPTSMGTFANLWDYFSIFK